MKLRRTSPRKSSKPPSPHLPIRYLTSRSLANMNERRRKKQWIGEHQVQYFIFKYTFKDDVTEYAKYDFNELLLSRYDADPHSIILYSAYDGKTVDAMIAKGKNRPQNGKKLETLTHDHQRQLMDWLGQQNIIEKPRATERLDYLYWKSAWKVVFESWVASGDYQMIQHNL
jgi:uncharacterized protein YggL (DUF469 family)